MDVQLVSSALLIRCRRHRQIFADLDFYQLSFYVGNAECRPKLKGLLSPKSINANHLLGPLQIIKTYVLA